MNKYLLFALLFGNLTFAQDYGMAGCGLGSKLWKNKKERSFQILAATSNLSLMNSFSITSGTAGCVEEGLSEEQTARLLYLQSHRDLILVESAQGQGEYLRNLSAYYGCQGEEGIVKLMNENSSRWSQGSLVEFSVEVERALTVENGSCSLSGS